MYLIALIVFLVGLVYGILVGQDSVSVLLNYYDLPSLFIVLFTSIPMLFASGLSADLKRAFKIISTRKVSYTKLELERSLEAVKLIKKLLVLSGILGTFIGLVAILCNLDDINTLGPNLAVALITNFYSLLGCLIFMPIQSKIKVLILSTAEEK